MHAFLLFLYVCLDGIVLFFSLHIYTILHSKVVGLQNFIHFGCV